MSKDRRQHIRLEQPSSPKDAVSLCSQAQHFTEQGMHKQAAQLLAQAAEIFPDDLNINVELGMALANADLLEEALHYFKKAAKIDDKDIDTHYFLGLTYYKLGDPERAKRSWKHCLKLDPGNISVQLCLSEAYCAMNQSGKALTHINNVLEADPGNRDALISKGVIYLEEAEKLTEQAENAKLSGDKDEEEKKTHLAQETNEEAIAIFRECITRYPSFSQGHGNLGLAYFSRGFIDAGIMELKKALSLDPEDPDILFNLGHAMALKGKADEAYSLLLKALENDSSPHPDCLNILTSIELNRKEYEKAEEHAELSVKIDDENVNSLVRMGEALFRQNKLERAKKYFYKALRLNPDFLDAYNLLALTYKAEGNLEKALKIIKQCFNINTRDYPQYIDPEYPFEIGCLYMEIGHKLKDSKYLEKAEKFWKIAISYDKTLAEDVKLEKAKYEKS
ncbi:MAG: tetratricopeptide repeat protein [bacterium]|nr:tetratricopeptide repeat protein [bacterium]